MNVPTLNIKSFLFSVSLINRVHNQNRDIQSLIMKTQNAREIIP